MSLSQSTVTTNGSGNHDPQRVLQAARSCLGRLAKSKDPIAIDAAHRLQQDLKNATKVK